MIFFKNYFDDMSKSISSGNEFNLKKMAEFIEESSSKGNRVWIAGNGGSAGIAGHVAVDFTKAAGVPCTTFHDPSLITCFANDYGYENWLKECVRKYISKDDIIILISSSGSSANIVNAAKLANEIGCSIYTFTGFKSKNPLSSQSKTNFHLASSNYNLIEMSHHIWLLSVVDYIAELRKNK